MDTVRVRVDIKAPKCIDYYCSGTLVPRITCWQKKVDGWLLRCYREMRVPGRSSSSGVRLIRQQLRVSELHPNESRAPTFILTTLQELVPLCRLPREQWLRLPRLQISCTPQNASRWKKIGRASQIHCGIEYKLNPNSRDGPIPCPPHDLRVQSPVGFPFSSTARRAVDGACCRNLRYSIVAHV